MKNKIIIFLVAAILLFFGACNKDLGNYTYSTINELVSVKLGTHYSVFQGDDLTIDPQALFSQDNALSSERYSFLWTAMNVSNLSKTDIGTESIFNDKIALVPGEYFLYLKITDKVTNVTWIKMTNLIVATRFSRGWMLVGENKDGFAEIEMVSMPELFDTTIIKGILGNSNLPKIKNPTNIIHVGKYGGHTRIPRVYLFANGASYCLDGQTFNHYPNYDFLRITYSTEPLPADAYAISYVTPVNNHNGSTATNFERSAVLYSNGYIYNGDLAYGTPCLRSSTSLEPVIAEPYVFYSRNDSPNAWMIYEKKIQKFSWARIFNINCEETPADKETDPFPWQNASLKRELCYGENVSTGDSFALIKDDEGMFHIYHFNVGGAPLKKGYYKILPNAVDIEKAKLFAFSGQRSILFYAVGSKLYAYNYNTGNEKMDEIEMGDEITMLKFNDLIGASPNDFYVATYNESKGGKIQKYILGSDPNSLDLVIDSNTCWTGLSKICNMNWRNSPE